MPGSDQPRARLSAAVLLAAVACLWLALAPVPALEIAEAATGRPIARWHVGDGREFVLSYTHSMYGAEVRERYVADPGGRLRRLEIKAASAAAAEYYAYTVAAQREGDWYVVAGPPMVLEDLLVRVDAVGRPALTLAGERLPLLAVAGDGDQVRIRVVFLPRVADVFTATTR